MKANSVFIGICGFLLIMMTGCHREFSRVSRGADTTRKEYLLKEPITINHYILYNAKAHLSFSQNSYSVPISEDSLMQVFWSSFEKLDLPLKTLIEEGENHVDSVFYKDYMIKIRKIDERWIKDVADIGTNDMVIVPIIHILTRNSYTGFISSGGIAGSSGFNVVSFVDVIVFIVDNGEIIYSRHIRHSSDITKANSRAEAEAVPPAPLVTIVVNLR